MHFVMNRPAKPQARRKRRMSFRLVGIVIFWVFAAVVVANRVFEIIEGNV